MKTVPFVLLTRQRKRRGCVRVCVMALAKESQILSWSRVYVDSCSEKKGWLQSLDPRNHW